MQCHADDLVLLNETGEVVLINYVNGVKPGS